MISERAPTWPEEVRAAAGPAPFLRLIRLAGYLGVVTIALLSLVPVELRPSTGFAKQLEHGIAYSIVAAVLTVSGITRGPRILALVALAGALELGQNFVPGRDANPLDFFASSAGALIGFGLGSLAWGVKPRLSRMHDIPCVSLLRGRFGTVSAIAVAGLLMVAASLATAHGAAGWFGAGLGVTMLAIATVDGQLLLIPDFLSVAGLAMGFLNLIVLEEGDLGPLLADATLRATVVSACFFGLRWAYARLRGRQGIGLGDVKLAAVAGIWLDWTFMPVAIEIAAVSALFVYVFRRYVLKHPLTSTSRLPFGLYFAPAIWIGWLIQINLLRIW